MLNRGRRNEDYDFEDLDASISFVGFIRRIRHDLVAANDLLVIATNEFKGTPPTNLS